MYIVGVEASRPVTSASESNQVSTGQTSFAAILRQEQSALESIHSGNAIETLTGVKPNENGAITLEALELAAYEDLDAFTSRFNSLLIQNGIDITRKIELGHEPGSGKVIVKNDHPDKEKIEALFEENPSLRNEYTKATSSLNFVAECKRAVEFKNAYAINPEQAVKDFSYLWHTHMDVSISFENGSYEVSTEQVQDSGLPKFTPSF